MFVLKKFDMIYLSQLTRLSRIYETMICLNHLREHPELYKQSAQKRHLNCDIDQILLKDKALREQKTDLDKSRSLSNSIAKSMGKASEQERADLIKQGSSLKKEIAQKEQELRESEQKFKELCLSIPNLLPTDTPEGKTDQENRVLSSHLEPTKFSFEPLDHLQIAQNLDLIDFEAGAKVAGSKFYFLKNEAVLLSMALTQLAMSVAIKKGYTPLMTPDLAKNNIVLGAGYNPRRDDGESEIYSIEGHDLSLIGTAEIPVGGLHSGEILSKEALPLKYVAFSHCFRTEAGSAGQRSKGLYRVHQFDKVELFQITTQEQSEQALEELREIEEELFQLLEIPYRVMHICAGDLGAPAYKKYDLEAWMPGKGEQGEYGEVTSCSNCTDFQARRLAIRYKEKESKKNLIAHTLNGTALAISRAMVALLENHQQVDGSIKIPKALQPFFGQMDKIKSKSLI